MAMNSLTRFSGDGFCVSSNPVFLEKKFSETSVAWNITSFEKKAESGEALMSPLFTCSDSHWQLILYPHGLLKEKYEDADLYLKNENRDCSKSHREFNTYFKINVTGDSNADFRRKYTFSPEAKSEKFSFEVFHEEDDPIVWKTGYLKINLTLCVEEDGYPVAPLIKSTQLHKDEKNESILSGCFLTLLSSDLEELYKNPQLSDVTLKLDNEEFQAHKSVLSARSKVFAAMFEQDNQMKTVDLVQMEAETVKDMLRYIYCGNVRELSPKEALNLYVAADRYNLKELKTFCRKVFIRK